MVDLVGQAKKQLGGLASKVGLTDTKSNTAPYTIEPSNWYKSLPYGFSFFSRNNKSGSRAKSTVWLPIAPENISVKTHFATNVITTLYGVVEEHSEVRYYDITIKGTTGYVPRFNAPIEDGVVLGQIQSAGRDSFQDSRLSSKLDFGGFLPEVTNTIQQVEDTIQGFNEALNGQKNPTGVTPRKSGYYAFHQLYQFFLKYKKDTAGNAAEGKTGGGLKDRLVKSALAEIGVGGGGGSSSSRQVHPLQFLNYKDNLKYDCVPMDFTLTRSSSSPMLYDYNIRLRAYNLRGVNASGIKDQLDLLSNNLAKLGLDGLEGQSAFAGLAGVAGDAATLVSAIF